MMTRIYTAFVLMLWGGVCLADSDVSRLVAELGADEYAVRQQATRRVAAIGAPAVELLEQAASKMNGEQSLRALQLLGRFLNGPDSDARVSSRAALERLAAGESATATRARSILQPASNDHASNPPRRLAPAVQVQKPIRIQNNFKFQFGRGGGRQISTRIVNGVRDISATENGRTIKIHDEPGKLIVEIREAGKSRKFEANNLEQLRKQSEEAAREYQKYAKPNGIKVLGGFNRGKVDFDKLKQDIEDARQQRLKPNAPKE